MSAIQHNATFRVAIENIPHPCSTVHPDFYASHAGTARDALYAHGSYIPTHARARTHKGRTPDHRTETAAITRARIETGCAYLICTPGKCCQCRPPVPGRSVAVVMAPGTNRRTQYNALKNSIPERTFNYACRTALETTILDCCCFYVAIRA